MAVDLSIARRAERLGAWCTTCFLLAFLALDASAINSRLSQRTMLDRVAAGAPLDASEAAAHDLRRRHIGNLTLAALAGTAVLWLAWLHRAYGNLALIGSKRSRFARSRALGYWFIPFLNLVRPFQVMKDLWLRSESMNDSDAYDDLPAPPLLSAWWGLSLTRGLSALALTSLGQATSTPSDLIDITDLGMLVNALGVVSALLAIGVVQGIDRRQQCFQATPPDLYAATLRSSHAPRPRSAGSETVARNEERLVPRPRSAGSGATAQDQERL